MFSVDQCPLFVMIQSTWQIPSFVWGSGDSGRDHAEIIDVGLSEWPDPDTVLLVECTRKRSIESQDEKSTCTYQVPTTMWLVYSCSLGAGSLLGGIWKVIQAKLDMLAYCMFVYLTRENLVPLTPLWPALVDHLYPATVALQCNDGHSSSGTEKRSE